MKRIIAVIMFIALLVSFASCGNKKSGKDGDVTGTLVTYYEAEDKVVYRGFEEVSNYPGNISLKDFKPVCRIALACDLNFGGESSRADAFVSACENYIKNDSSTSVLDAIALFGTLTANADENTLSGFNDYLDKGIECEPLTLVRPGAEYMSEYGEALKASLPFDIERNITVNDITVISFGEETGDIAAVEEKVTEAEELYPETPVFLLTTAAGSDKLTEFVSEHKQIVLITDSKTEIGDTVKTDSNMHINIGDSSVFCIIESDEYSRTLVRLIDENGSVIKNENGENVEWFIQTPWDVGRIG